MITLGSSNPAVVVGDYIKITKMIDPYEDYTGRTGQVLHIDSLGQLHGTWGGLAIIPEEDEFIILERN